MKLSLCFLVLFWALAAPSKSRAEPLDKTLSLQGITFRVESSNAGSLNQLKVTPKGLERSNEVIEREIDGTVTGVEIADLNADGSPELYLFVTSAGSGSYGTVIGFSANRKKSLSEIFFPEIDPKSREARGYQGHDEFAIVENVLARRFPIYREDDANAKPTGGTRQLQYQLHAGEAGWRLKLTKTVEY